MMCHGITGSEAICSPICWIRGNLWLAAAIAIVILLLGDAVGHLRRVVANHNSALNNSGIFLYAKFIVPVLMLWLTPKHRQMEARSRSAIVE